MCCKQCNSAVSVHSVVVLFYKCCLTPLCVACEMFLWGCAAVALNTVETGSYCDCVVQNITEELHSNRTAIDSLHEQASNLGEQVRYAVMSDM